MKWFQDIYFVGEKINHIGGLVLKTSQKELWSENMNESTLVMEKEYGMCNVNKVTWRKDYIL